MQWRLALQLLFEGWHLQGFISDIRRTLVRVSRQ